jgi:predicted transcriptional regulator of viral defense system
VNLNDAIINEVAARQHGVATRAQLLEAGVSLHVVDARVRRGRLLRVHQATYRVASQEPTIRTLAMAAVLATAGPERAHVAISHVGAAVLWGFPGWDPPQCLDVSGTAPRRVPGVSVHRVALCDDEVTTVHGIHVTTPERTVLDLAGTGTARQVEQALAAAERGARHRRMQIVALLQRRPHHPGSGKLRALLAHLAASGRAPLFLRSRAEELALDLCDRAGLPTPRANERIAEYEVDFVWPEQHVIVEVDGYEFHGSRKAFHGDRDRDCALATAGYHVLRFTWRQLTEKPTTCLAAICIALGQSLRPT